MIITIPQKPSNFGSVHDLASDQYDRIINMGERFNYAVILPAFYGDTVTRHKDLYNAAIRYKSLERDGFNPVILDRQGNEHQLDCTGALMPRY